MSNVKVAAIQMSCDDNQQNNLEKARNFVIEAAKQQAKIVLLPELFDRVYFCQEKRYDYYHYAMELNEHPSVKMGVELAKQYDVVLPISFYERDGNVLYNSVACIDATGEILGVYRKTHIPDDHFYQEKFYFTPGNTGFKVFNSKYGNIGIGICWDQWFPEAARIMALNGADILIYPTAIGWFDADNEAEKKRQLEAWQTIQRGHAIANGLPLASINRVGFEPDFTSKNEGIRFFGNSFVCGPQGEILAQASNDKEEILYAFIDYNRTKAVRDIWPFFRDRRIEHYHSLLHLYGK